MREHALVKHYGCPPEAMELTRAHGQVEGGHRRRVADGPRARAAGGDVEHQVVATCEAALGAWHAYRDGVAERMHLRRP